MSAITVLKENVPHGPFTRAEVADKLARGEITLDSLAFVEGLSEWTPLRNVLAKVDATSPAPAAKATYMPIGTGYGMEQPKPGSSSLPIGAGYSYAVTMQPPSHLVYAGFWLRVVAILIDGLILSPLIFIYLGLEMAVMSTSNQGTQVAFGVAMLVVLIIFLIGKWLYFALQESSRAQATVGKRLMGIQVTDRQGGRISFGRATGRYFGKIVSGMILLVGYMMAGWTERKQALHDMLADTLVVRKPGA